MSQGEPTQAWVLHRRPYREGSYLVELLTPTQGRVTTVWRRPKKGCQGEIFSPVQGVISGRGDVKTLSRLEASSAPLFLKGEAFYFGIYLNELLYRGLSHFETSGALFEAYSKALTTLSHGANQQALRMVEYALFEELGLWPDLSFCSTSQSPVVAQQRYHVSLASGVEVLEHGDWDGDELLQLSRGEFDSSYARKLFKTLTDELLEGKPLKSRELYRDYQHSIRL